MDAPSLITALNREAITQDGIFRLSQDALELGIQGIMNYDEQFEFCKVVVARNAQWKRASAAVGFRTDEIRMPGSLGSVQTSIDAGERRDAISPALTGSEPSSEVTPVC